MRRFLFSVFIFLVLCGAFFMIPEKPAPTESSSYLPLYRIMELAEAEVVGGELHYWASLKEQPGIIALPQLERKAEQLLGRLTADTNFQNGHAGTGPWDVRSFSHALPASEPGGQEVCPSYMVVEKEGRLGTGTTVRLLLQNMEEEHKNVLHLLVTLSAEGNARELSTCARRLPAVFRSEVKENNLSFCLTGHLPKQLSAEETEELLQNIISALGGEEVQGIKEGSLVSVTGYTPDLGDYLKAEDLRINFNLALRYDHYLDKTVLWAGTPLIACWY